MIIDRVESFPLLYEVPVPYGDANGLKRYRASYLIRITTASGLSGWGECVDWLPTLDRGFRERIAPFLLGQDAARRISLVRTVRKWHARLASAVSMALTEIAAKRAGLSVCELWGGRFRESVPVYASFQSYGQGEDWMELSVKRVERAVREGHTRLKIKIGGRPLAEDQEHVVRLQEMLAGSASLAVDANQSYDSASARGWVPVFARWSNWMWLEEPLPLDREAEYRLLRQALPLPVAGGENLTDASSFLPLLRSQALDVYQPDPLHADGIDGFRSILQLARDFGYRASPHVFDGSLSRLYALFAQACLPPWSKMAEDEVEPVEWDVMDNPFNRLVPVQPVNGRVRIPDGPGIGVELDEELLSAYRWDGRTYT